jgi:hypothetical protein
MFHHALHMLHHLRRRGCPLTGLCRLLLGCLGSTGMMLMLLLRLGIAGQG